MIEDINSKGVPLIVTHFIEAVERLGLLSEGVYRLSSVKSRVDALRTVFSSFFHSLSFNYKLKKKKNEIVACFSKI